MELEYIKCHGSGNEFVMVDAVGAAWAGAGYGNPATCGGVDLAMLARYVCDRRTGIGADGLLLTVRNADGVYGMRMLNPDGSEAEMCGNGIRCVARQVSERYTAERAFTLTSGGRDYPVVLAGEMAAGVAAYGADIAVRLQSGALPMTAAGEFVGKAIPELDEKLLFTAINVGNPHIIARVDSIDFVALEKMGERIKSLTHTFPQGVNLSLVEVRGENRIFVATYERGAGITSSCGTAMTSSATAMALLGECAFDTEIEVVNRGGAVRCRCSRGAEGLHTRLTGNATYMSAGRIAICGDAFRFECLRTFGEEAAAYAAFKMSVN